MKKTAVLVLIFLYALSSFGIGIRQFYCCGKLKATSLNIIASPKKSCSAGESNGCCNTKYQYFKVKDSHFGTQEINSPFNHLAEAPLLLFPTWDLSLVTTQTSSGFFAHAPPLPPCTPIYIMNCVYRI